jgi:hypothetical protein
MGHRAIQIRLQQLEWELSKHRKRLERLRGQLARLRDAGGFEAELVTREHDLRLRIEEEQQIIQELEEDITHLRSGLADGGLRGETVIPKWADKTFGPRASDGFSMADGSRIVEKKTDTAKPHSRKSKLEAYGIARLVECAPNRPLLHSHDYTLEAGISLRPLKGFAGTRIKIPRREDTMVFDIAVFSAGIEISPTWLQTVTFEPKKKSKATVQFTLVPREVGDLEIQVEFYYERHWLAEIEFKIEVVETQGLVPA